jgi:hypothetical protein
MDSRLRAVRHTPRYTATTRPSLMKGGHQTLQTRQTENCWEPSDLVRVERPTWPFLPATRRQASAGGLSTRTMPARQTVQRRASGLFSPACGRPPTSRFSPCAPHSFKVAPVMAATAAVDAGQRRASWRVGSRTPGRPPPGPHRPPPRGQRAGVGAREVTGGSPATTGRWPVPPGLRLPGAG